MKKSPLTIIFFTVFIGHLLNVVLPSAVAIALHSVDIANAPEILMGSDKKVTVRRRHRSIGRLP